MTTRNSSGRPPGYLYPFERESAKLWAAPVDQTIRGWERRLGIGLEFKAKAAYAKMIAGAVAATGEAPLVNRTIVSGIGAGPLSRMTDVKMIKVRRDGIEIETPRYDRFTRLLVELAGLGATVHEIAGNDEIMVSLTVPEGAALSVDPGSVLMRLKRDGVPGDRVVVNIKVESLAAFLRQHPLGNRSRARLRLLTRWVNPRPPTRDPL